MKTTIIIITFLFCQLTQQNDKNLNGKWTAIKSLGASNRPCDKSVYKDFYLKFFPDKTFEIQYSTEQYKSHGQYEIIQKTNKIHFTEKVPETGDKFSYDISIISFEKDKLVLDFGLCEMRDTIPNPGRLELKRIP
jgi:hypothetical protein